MPSSSESGETESVPYERSENSGIATTVKEKVGKAQEALSGATDALTEKISNIGLLTGLLLPRTRQEDKLIGGKSDRLLSKSRKPERNLGQSKSGGRTSCADRYGQCSATGDNGPRSPVTKFLKSREKSAQSLVRQDRRLCVLLRRNN